MCIRDRFVEELEERRIELLQQFAGLALVGLLLRPEGEDLLRGGEGFPEAADADGGREGVIAIFGEEVELITEVFEVVVDRGGGKQQNLGANAGFDDVVHEPLVAAFADEVALVVTLAGGVVAEVVRLVDDDEIVVAPVQGREIEIARSAGLAAEVGVRENVVAETVIDERIEEAVVAIDGPVVAQLLRAEHEDALVFQLEVFHDRERFVGCLLYTSRCV